MTLAPGDLVLDWSYDRPSLSVAKSSGAKGVIRYSAGAASASSHPSHSANAGKLITPAEFRAIIAAGLDLIANDEWYETRVTEGASAGHADGLAAATLWKSCGLARGATIYPSWDAAPSSSKWAAVDAYLLAYATAIKAVNAYVPGMYAGTPYLKHALANGRIRLGWRPNAGSWSNDGLPYQPSTNTAAKRAALVKLAITKTPAHIWQTGNYWFNKGADENLILRAGTGSHREALAAAAPKPPAPPVTPPKPLPPYYHSDGVGSAAIAAPAGQYAWFTQDDGRLALHKFDPATGHGRIVRYL